MNTIIKKVHIHRLWDYKDIDCSLNEDVNILIGTNGTSKTTFLQVVEAILNADLLAISDIHFEYVKIEIITDGIEHTILVNRMLEDEISPMFRYQIDQENAIDIMLSDYRGYYSKLRLSSRSAYTFLKERLEKLIQISWLSITRVDDKEDRRTEEADVDRKLNKLMRKIVSFRLELETQVNDRTKKFNEDIVSLLLYNQNIDALPNNKMYSIIKSFSEEDLRQELHKTFSFFGKAREHSEDINLHVMRIQRLKKIMEDKEKFSAEDILSFSLLNRTARMLTISQEYQSDRAQIIEPIKKYIEIIASFTKDKIIEFNGKGELCIYLKSKNSNSIQEKKGIAISSLSSGEKQLLILLTETLLQQKEPFVYIADEPELSLHIEWQRNLISSIRTLNPNAQIIFATHAPEIAANYSKKLIQMERITAYE